MSDVALLMEQIYKKFRKGEIYNSLRDLLPALTGKLFRQQELNQADKREFWALQDISFEVRRGEAFGIIGHNGAGKSTALKILSRIMKPSKGRMVINGRVSALIEVAAGFHQDLTGRENIFLHGTILGMTKREISSKLDQIIAFSGIEEFIDTPVKRYSSGMYARLGFAVAAHVDPEVLVVDEVLSVGDYAFQRKCIERMKEIVSRGTSVLFVSHNLKTVAEFCSRTMLLERGRVVTIGPTQDAISAYLNRAGSTHAADAASVRVVITKVRVRNEHGDCARFQSGEKAWIDVEVKARKRSPKLSIALYITDDNFVEVFDTASERLGVNAFSLDEGEAFACTFELQLNMVAGIFHPSVLVYRNDTQAKYDRWAPAATIYIGSEEDVGGKVHCFPKVTRQEFLPASDAAIADVAREPAGAGKRDAD
jgi:lipopolysaccharide transport system ATP-binding protein